MNRQQKESVVAEFQKMFTESASTFLIDYKGLSVAQMQALRKSLKQQDSVLKITKARLMKIAAQKASGKVDGLGEFKDAFQDQIGLIFGQEPSAIAKSLVDFSKKNQQLSVLSALYEARVIDKQEIAQLAKLPSRDVLLAQLVGTMQAPIAGFARSLNAVLSKLAYALNAVKEQKEKE